MKKKKPFYKVWWFWAIVIVILMIIGIVSPPDDDQSSEPASTVPKESKKHVVSKTKKTDSLTSQIKKAATPKFGDVTKIEINDDLGKNDGGKIVLVYIKQDGITKRVADMYTTNSLKEVFKINKVNEVTYFWQENLTDSEGNKSLYTVEKVQMNKETAKGIDWNNFIYTNLGKVADSYHIDPSLK